MKCVMICLVLTLVVLMAEHGESGAVLTALKCTGNPPICVQTRGRALDIAKRRDRFRGEAEDDKLKLFYED